MFLSAVRYGTQANSSIRACACRAQRLKPKPGSQDGKWRTVLMVRCAFRRTQGTRTDRDVIHEPSSNVGRFECDTSKVFGEMNKRITLISHLNPVQKVDNERC